MVRGRFLEVTKHEICVKIYCDIFSVYPNSDSFVHSRIHLYRYRSFRQSIYWQQTNDDRKALIWLHQKPASLTVQRESDNLVSTTVWISCFLDLIPQYFVFNLALFESVMDQFFRASFVTPFIETFLFVFKERNSYNFYMENPSIVYFVEFYKTTFCKNKICWINNTKIS